jgi:hypothetical protein
MDELFAEKIASSYFSEDCIEKTKEGKEPDVPTHKQKELSECDEMINYPVYRMSLGDFEI